MAEMREKLMHFFDIGDGTENYVLLGDGINSRRSLTLRTRLSIIFTSPAEQRM